MAIRYFNVPGEWYATLRSPRSILQVGFFTGLVRPFRISAGLFLLYALWVSFATILNTALFLLN